MNVPGSRERGGLAASSDQEAHSSAPRERRRLAAGGLKLVKHAGVKRLLHLTGSTFAVSGIIFVAIRLDEYEVGTHLTRFGPAAWVFLVALVFVYLLANVLQANAWWHLLLGFGAERSRGWGVKLYGITQLAKYVPGNIFHLAGRQAMGMADGVPVWPLAKAVVWELGMLSFTGATFGFLALPWLVHELPVWAAITAFTLAIAIAGFGLLRFFGPRFARAFGSQLLFLAICGLIFVALVALVEGESHFNWLPLAGAFVLAWLAGLVTPGAPAGLGVRELVLLFLLKGSIDEANLVLAVVLGRIVTVSGDLLFFVIASVMKNEATHTST
jgi:glycosyltransferase 2 family protein